MYTHADKTQENENHLVVNEISQKHSDGNDAFQFLDNRPESITHSELQDLANDSPQANRVAQLQAMANSYSVGQQQPSQRIENNTGLPDNLKTGTENLSGISMDDVKVHYNSDKPAQLHAHAYAQGTDIHLGSGQEKHLPHEAWHVVQQKQGRVKPSVQLKGKVSINDDPVLEREADVMGAKAALNFHESYNHPVNVLISTPVPQRSVIQRQQHGIIGTMLHHAPANLGDTTIDEVNGLFYGRGILDSRRGELRDIPETTYDWDFRTLADKIHATRRRTRLPAQSFPVVVNANWMVSPGYEAAPKEYADMDRAIFAINSVWGFKYKLPDGGSNDDYATVLDRWRGQRDQMASSRQEEIAFGDKAKKLLRTPAKAKVGDSRNDAIPHRGLRNMFFKDRWFQSELESLERTRDYVHVMTLDSDANLGDGDVLDEIADLAEAQLADGGISITATDYVYEKNNLFEWFSSLMDKIGRRILEAAGYDAYPGEPGLTISYASGSGRRARGFLQDDPFGPEYSGDPTDRLGGFKEHVNSSQSVEGKNIREKWRGVYGEPDKAINRTSAHLNVEESDGQRRGHGPTLGAIAELAEAGSDITPELISTLINSDNYHSLTRDRNSRAKQLVQHQAIVRATTILNRVLTDHREDGEAVIRRTLNQALLRL